MTGGSTTRRLIIILLALFTFCSANAQSKTDLDQRTIFGIWYDQSIGLESNDILYNKIVNIQARGTGSHQFFEKRFWTPGSLKFKNQVFDSVYLLYDIEVENIFIRHTDPLRSEGILIDQNKLESFTILGHQFAKIPVKEAQGFYDILYSGNTVSLVAKRKKTSRLEAGGLKFKELPSFFLLNQDELILLKGAKSISKAYPELKDTVKTISSSVKLKSRIKDEAAAIEFVRMLDQSIKGE